MFSCTRTEGVKSSFLGDWEGRKSKAKGRERFNTMQWEIVGRPGGKTLNQGAVGFKCVRKISGSLGFVGWARIGTPYSTVNM